MDETLYTGFIKILTHHTKIKKEQNILEYPDVVTGDFLVLLKISIFEAWIFYMLNDTSCHLYPNIQADSR